MDLKSKQLPTHTHTHNNLEYVTSIKYGNVCQYLAHMCEADESKKKKKKKAKCPK